MLSALFFFNSNTASAASADPILEGQNRSLIATGRTEATLGQLKPAKGNFSSGLLVAPKNNHKESQRRLAFQRLKSPVLIYFPTYF